MDSKMLSGISSQKVHPNKLPSLKHEYVAKIDFPGNFYLAKQFEASMIGNSSHVIVESVKAMHQGMESAYKALFAISRYAEHFVSESARTTFFDMSKQHLTNNMKMGVYPENECRVDSRRVLNDDQLNTQS